MTEIKSTIVRGVQIPAVTRDAVSSNPLLTLNVGEAYIESIGVGADPDKVKRKLQSRAGHATKKQGYRFSVRFLNQPLVGVTGVTFPAIGVWRTV